MLYRENVTPQALLEEFEQCDLVRVSAGASATRASEPQVVADFWSMNSFVVRKRRTALKTEVKLHFPKSDGTVRTEAAELVSAAKQLEASLGCLAAIRLSVTAQECLRHFYNLGTQLRVEKPTQRTRSRSGSTLHGTALEKRRVLEWLRWQATEVYHGLPASAALQSPGL